MKQWMMSSMLLLLLLSACTPGEPPVGPPTPDARRPDLPGRADLPPGEVRAAPMVRVGIVLDTASVAAGAAAPFELSALTGEVLARGEAGQQWQLTRVAGGGVRVAAGAQELGVFELPVRLTVRSGEPVQIGGRPYRGQALVIARGADRLSAINIVDMELYLLGVVPREMGRRPASEIEALKAQAVAARTYAVGNMGGHEDQGFDFYATIADQVYGGVADEDSIVSRAVQETRGEIITWQGRPIMAYYSSTCGGHTAAMAESWPWRGSAPYLKGVSDRIPGTDEYYCSSSSRFRWRTEWTREQLLAVLGQTLAAHTGGTVRSARRITDIELVERGGEAERAVIDLTVDGHTHRLRADSIRWVLRPQPGPAILNSSMVLALSATKQDGQVEKLTIEGGGWGHAIGMCQVGAMGRARAGQSYRDILLAYYTDTSIDRVY